ncbi:MAG: HAD family hydrolase [Treponema sp.]|nr:HAD family hydrolase [Treponema sp.]
MFDYLFFDLDGTLTDPAQGITNSFIHALKYFGLEIPSYETLCTFIGPPLPDTFKTHFGFDEAKAAEGVKKYREYFATKGLLENSVYPGIPELLSGLKQAGKKLVVATSKPEEYSVRIIEHFGLAQYFENVCGSLMDESRSKKDEVIAYAIERNHISDKSKILMIGDRKHDILGAKKTGLKSCGVLYGYGSQEELESAGADYIVKDISQLHSILL